jgi:hypothetical protein
MVLMGSGLAGAQEAAPAESIVDDLSRRGDSAWRLDTAPSPGLIEFGTDGKSARPRLRMRFDAATRAVRSLGVDAESCSSLLRSSSRSRATAPGGEERRSLAVSFAVSCRFF